MVTKITSLYSFEVLDFNWNDFGFTFNIGVSYLDIIIRHQCSDHVYVIIVFCILLTTKEKVIDTR